MTTRLLGNSDLAITPIGVGAWAMGGAGWAFSWGPQDDEDSIAAIHHAIDLGVNWIDTAAVYGFGHSEEVVGKAVRGLSQKPLIFTKCSRTWDGQGNVGSNLKAESVRAECEASLRRLGVGCIDLYQIHWPRPDEDLEEGWSTMAALQREGKVRWIGASNFSAEQLRRAHAIAPVSSLQPPYSLIRRDIETDVLPWCAENNVGVIAYSPMGSGLLTGTMSRERIAALSDDDWRKRTPSFQEPALSENLGIAERLGAIGARHGRTAGEAAIAWTLRQPAVTAAIVGVRNPNQVDGIIGAAAFRLSDREIEEIC